MMGLSVTAAAFVAANKRSPVVSAFVHGTGGQGATYTLQNGQTFELNRADCNSVEPRWKHSNTMARP